MTNDESTQATDYSRSIKRSTSRGVQAEVNGESQEGSGRAHTPTIYPRKSRKALNSQGAGTFSSKTQRITSASVLEIREAYVGMLPKPEDFDKYPPAVQERWCKWNDSYTSDESHRQDKLVAAEIQQSKASLWITTMLIGSSMLLAFITFIITGSAWSFGFLAVPLISIIANVFMPVASKSSQHINRQQADYTGNNTNSE